MFSLKITPILAADADARAEPGGFFPVKKEFPLPTVAKCYPYGFWGFLLQNKAL